MPKTGGNFPGIIKMRQVHELTLLELAKYHFEFGIKPKEHCEALPWDEQPIYIQNAHIARMRFVYERMIENNYEISLRAKEKPEGWKPAYETK